MSVPFNQVTNPKTKNNAPIIIIGSRYDFLSVFMLALRFVFEVYLHKRSLSHINSVKTLFLDFMDKN